VSAIFNYGYKVTESWQAGGKARFIYLPPGLIYALAKFSLIDLEAYDYAIAA
jgi:hypothetical protein